MPDAKNRSVGANSADLNLSCEDQERIERGIEQINPTSDRKADCYREIERFMLYWREARDSGRTLNARQFRWYRDSAKRVLAVLKKAKTECESFSAGPPPIRGALPPTEPLLDIHEYMEDLLSAIELFEGLAAMPISGGRAAAPFKYDAAIYAHHLILKFGQEPPALTIDGAFYNLASILYESVTGIKGADLDWMCRKVIDSERELTLAAQDGRLHVTRL